VKKFISLCIVSFLTVCCSGAKDPDVGDKVQIQTYEGKWITGIVNHVGRSGMLIEIKGGHEVIVKWKEIQFQSILSQ
jgi:hypothetical protein